MKTTQSFSIFKFACADRCICALVVAVVAAAAAWILSTQMFVGAFA